jgi:hypothetical protein
MKVKSFSKNGPVVVMPVRIIAWQWMKSKPPRALIIEPQKKKHIIWW